MGHKIKYGAKFFLKIKYFPYLPTHFFGGHVTGNQHIIYFGLACCQYFSSIHFCRYPLPPPPPPTHTHKMLSKFWQGCMMTTGYQATTPRGDCFRPSHSDNRYVPMLCTMINYKSKLLVYYPSIFLIRCFSCRRYSSTASSKSVSVCSTSSRSDNAVKTWSQWTRSTSVTKMKTSRRHTLNMVDKFLSDSSKC